jgi:glutaredoxin/glutathione-dependent peroxiredoxin
MIKVGDTLPAVTVNVMNDGPKPQATQEFFQNARVVLFSVPGAFTPTCSARHLPSYVENMAALKEKGIEKVACMAVNDAFVMDAWSKTQSADGVTMLADGNAEFTKALGLELDASKYGMGLRSRRFALVANNGVVTHLFVEAPGEFKVSAADHVLANI